MATTKITANVLALSAAQSNINSGSTFNVTVPTTIAGNLTVDTDSLVVNSSSNRVGIGTTTGSATLNVFRNAGTTVLNLNDTMTRAGLSVRSANNTDTTLHVSSHFNSTSILQVTNSGGTAAYNMSLNTYGGNIGIGTETPNERLTVSGNISATGNLSASNIYSSNELQFAPRSAQVITQRIYSDSSDQLVLGITSAGKRVYLGSAGNKYVANDHVSLGPLVGIGTTVPTQALTVVGNISATGDIRSNGNIIANGDDKYNTSYNLISADDVYTPNQLEIFNDFIHVGNNNFATFINLTGGSGSAGNSFSDGSPADIYVNQPTGSDRFTSRGVIQLQTHDSFNNAFAYVPSFSLFSNLAGYYTSNTAYRVYIARNDNTIYIRFGVQPALGGEYAASAYFTQRTLVMDTAVSPNFFFANCTGARTYVTSTSADTGIPALTGMWVNIHQDFNVTNVNTLTSVDLTVNYTRDSLKYTYKFLPGAGDQFVSTYNNYAKKQGGGILMGAQDTNPATRRKALLIDWWSLKTKCSPLSIANFPANWNSQRFTK